MNSHQRRKQIRKRIRNWTQGLKPGCAYRLQWSGFSLTAYVGSGLHTMGINDALRSHYAGATILLTFNSYNGYKQRKDVETARVKRELEKLGIVPAPELPDGLPFRLPTKIA